MTIPRQLDLATLQDGYRRGAFTPQMLVAEISQRMSHYADPAIWISRVSDAELSARAQTLADIPDGAARLPLYGVPFAVKDNIDVAGMRTTAACPDFAYLAGNSAAVVARLVDAGAICVGKTNLDQFATGLVGTRSPYGAPRCVFDSDYISGGSSSGSAVAVAAGLVGFALGTDTAGSGRVPAAFNNIVGLKPSCGRVSTRGVVPACRTLDCVSIFALSAADASDVIRVVEGFDAEDAFSRRCRDRRLSLDRFRFGVLAPEDREFFGDAEAAALYGESVRRLEALGGTAVECDFSPFRAAAKLLYEGPWLAERYAAVGAFLEQAPQSFDPTVRAVIAKGGRLTASETFEGLYRLAGLKRAAETQWSRMDTLLLPTAPAIYTVKDIEADPVGANSRLGLYTNFVNLLDCCAVAVPAGFRANGLPFGISLVAPAFADLDLAVLAGRFHQSTACGSGLFRETRFDPPPPRPDEDISLFVVGAHLSGMPLNREFAELGARFDTVARTTGNYRLFVLPDTQPKKPGLVRETRIVSAGIEGEIYRLPPESFGRFVSKIPAPLGIGKVELADGTRVSGFLCEAHAVAGAEEITALGGWRRYCASLT